MYRSRHPVRLIAGHAGKVIVTGLEKSGWVAQKQAATLQNALATPAPFLTFDLTLMHGGRGDLCRRDDPTIPHSKSGIQRLKLLQLEAGFAGIELPLIGIINVGSSPLTRQIDIAARCFCPG